MTRTGGDGEYSTILNCNLFIFLGDFGNRDLGKGGYFHGGPVHFFWLLSHNLPANN